MPEIVVFYDYPDGRVEISRTEAIQRQRGASIHVRGRDVYESDEQALDDFLVVQWGWLEHKPFECAGCPAKRHEDCFCEGFP